MRYDDFRDRWQAALRTARLLSAHDRPDETVNLTTTARKWRVHLLPRAVAPFHAGATIDFRWDAFEAARSYTCEEDLLTELLGRRAGRSTQPRLVRVDIALRAALPYGSTTPIPAPDVWLPWVASVEAKLDDALTTPRRRKGAIDAWRGDLENRGTHLAGWGVLAPRHVCAGLRDDRRASDLGRPEASSEGGLRRRTHRWTGEALPRGRGCLDGERRRAREVAPIRARPAPSPVAARP